MCPLSPNYQEQIEKRKIGGKNARIKQNKAKILPKISYKCICEKCGKEYQIILTESQFKKKKHFFCSRSCANSKKHTEEQKIKISQQLKKYYKTHTKKQINKTYTNCLACGKQIKINKSGYCVKCRYLHLSTETKQKLSLAGRKSIEHQKETRRSKNEIDFYNLCKEKFINVLHNEPLFNGWDADIILPDLKIAILWNGKWHYEKITLKHSVKQIQNRDKIKIKEIQNCNYIPYIIKDLGKVNHKKVQFEFEKFLKYLDKNRLQINK